KCIERGDGTKANEVLRTLQRSGEVEPPKVVACAKILETHKPEAAVEFYTQVLESAGAQDAGVALQCLQGLAKLNPSSVPLHQRLATAASRLGQVAAATAAYQKCGDLLSQQSKWGEAADAY